MRIRSNRHCRDRPCRGGHPVRAKEIKIPKKSRARGSFCAKQEPHPPPGRSENILFLAASVPQRDGETPCPVALQILVAVDEVPISPPLFSQIPLYLFHFWEKYGIMSRYREKRGKEGQRHGSF